VRLASWAADLFDLVLPPGCLACGTWVPARGRVGLLCARCRSRLPRAPWPRCERCHHPLGTGRVPGSSCRACRGWPDALAAARHAVVLAPPADVLVHALKYEGWKELAPEMGRAMARALSRQDLRPGDGVVVPVPTTPERVRTRGYNQARLLADAVGDALDLTVVEALDRTRAGATQVALHPSQRRANVRGVFAVREGHSSRLQGAHVLLVDDVLTTGATAGAAASELVRTGVSQVTLLTYARALPLLRAVGVSHL
jgi:ComF family protein